MHQDGNMIYNLIYGEKVKFWKKLIIKLQDKYIGMVV
jgi:hypothetical protein